jgi:hypothetical protein
MKNFQFLKCGLYIALPSKGLSIEKEGKKRIISREKPDNIAQSGEWGQHNSDIKPC